MFHIALLMLAFELYQCLVQWNPSESKMDTTGEVTCVCYEDVSFI